MKKRFFSILLVISMMATMLVGCGGSKDAEETAEEAGGKITFMAPDWAIPTDEQLDTFTEETGIEVEVSVVGWDDIREKLATAAAAGQCVADVVEVDWSWVGEFYAAEWLETLEVSDEDKADMPTLDTFSVNGNVLAIPYSNDYRIAYYNTEHFAAAGIDKAPETYAEVLDACRAIKAAGIVDYPFATSMNAEEKAATGLTWTAYQMNGVVFNEDGTFNEESVMEALKYYETLAKEELVAPEDITASGMEAYMRIPAGTASYLVGPTMFVSKNQSEDSAVVGKVEPILSPGKDAVATQTMALPEALGVTTASGNKEAAKKFVEWYTSADMQKELNATLGNLPTRNSVLEELINDGTIADAGAMLEQAELISSPYPGGVPAHYAEMSSAMYNAINKMALGEINAEEAYAEMSAALDALLAE